MSKKVLLLFAAFAIILLSTPLFARNGDAEQITATVRGFYRWYLLYDESPGRKDPIFETDEVYKYLTKDTVDYIREKYRFCDGEPCMCSINYDYFIKAQDLDPKDWLENMKISKPLFSDDKAVVAVILGSYKEMRRHLFVILKNDGGQWKIFDVINGKGRG